MTKDLASLRETGQAWAGRFFIGIEGDVIQGSAFSSSPEERLFPRPLERSICHAAANIIAVIRIRYVSKIIHTMTRNSTVSFSLQLVVVPVPTRVEVSWRGLGEVAKDVDGDTRGKIPNWWGGLCLVLGQGFQKLEDVKGEQQEKGSSLVHE